MIVDSSEVVARCVFAEIGEVDGVPVSLRNVLTAKPAHQSVTAGDLKALEPRHEAGIEKTQGEPLTELLGSGVELSTSLTSTSALTPSAVAS